MKLWLIFEYWKKAVENQIWDIFITVLFSLKSVKNKFCNISYAKKMPIMLPFAWCYNIILCPKLCRQNVFNPTFDVRIKEISQLFLGITYRLNN